MVPKSKISKLKKELTGHSLKPVAGKLNISEMAIYNVLNLKTYNEKVIAACVDYRDELRAKSQQLAARI